MFRRANLLLSGALVTALSLGLGTGTGTASDHAARFTPGAVGAGDPYFPTDGNGGYDVKHYLLDVRYAPATNRLTGVATISARATQNLSRFNLDLQGLTVRSIIVNGRPADWSRAADELTVKPRSGLPTSKDFTTVIRYDGIPQTLDDGSGFIHTDDGTVVIGEAGVADTWFPVNDHPIDKAAYTFKVAVPVGLEAVANGILKDKRTKGGWSTWTWEAKEPMASYLATATIGQFDLRAYQRQGIRYWDAFDPDLFDSAVPRTGRQYALSQRVATDEPAYKRLARTISVPAAGANLSFWINRDTEWGWDYVFVEAHTVGQEDWTTLRDLNGHTAQETGQVCPYWHALHPFLGHYQTAQSDGTCAPSGSSGSWWAASGHSDGYEQWKINLSAYSGKTVEVSITYASDDAVQLPGAVVDDIVVSTGPGTTSFEADADPLDGWTVPGPPASSAANVNDWIVGTAADAPPTTGEVVNASFARQTEIVDFLSGTFGRYPFTASGGIVDDADGLGFALENQTRPIYPRYFFADAVSGQGVIVHELAHQWFGDSLAVARWQHIWLNEGFATYAEWLWGEHDGLGTAQETFDFFYNLFPADDPFWTLPIGDPGADFLFEFPVYARGAMTLHQLRLAVGDADFFTILRTWAKTNRNGNVTTDQFIALAEKISGQQLDSLFQTWLFTTTKPILATAAKLTTTTTPEAASSLLARAKSAPRR
ncbi:M1 family aminopeptidase [Kribbella sp. NPDC049227]|uniref:M1 family aminopeptidase n=1 Tax=Kribbella sp. NPDC049227 TaxID=3364113 RepID=UPI0037172DA0